MGNNRQDRSPEREPINQPEYRLNDNNTVDKTRQEALRDDAMLLDKFRQVIKTRCNSERQKAEAQQGSDIADKR